MAVPGLALVIARLPLRGARAGTRLGGRLLRLTLLGAAATAVVLVLDVLLLEDGSDASPR
jgi:hypothetical protein